MTIAIVPPPLSQIVFLQRRVCQISGGWNSQHIETSFAAWGGFGYRGISDSFLLDVSSFHAPLLVLSLSFVSEIVIICPISKEPNCRFIFCMSSCLFANVFPPVFSTQIASESPTAESNPCVVVPSLFNRMMMMGACLKISFYSSLPFNPCHLLLNFSKIILALSCNF